MKLTNQELIALSDPNVSQEVKNHICKQKMTPQEIAICDKTGTSPVDYMIQKTMV